MASIGGAKITMTLTLLLIRHAVAEPGNGADFARGLLTSGLADAADLGRFLVEQSLMPDLIYRSSARRARETADQLCSQLTSQPTIVDVEQLYMASPDDICDLVFDEFRPEKSAAKIIAIVAHSPGVPACALSLIEAVASESIDRFPPGALAAISFDAASWKDADQSAGRLTYFRTPGDGQ